MGIYFSASKNVYFPCSLIRLKSETRTLIVTITNQKTENMPRVMAALSKAFFLLMKVREEGPFLFLGDNSSLSPVICVWPL